jgi:tetratricopeptide (TPR) repeat protein
VRGISALIPKAVGAEEQQNKHSLLKPVLKDQIRAVRSETARALTEVQAKLFDHLDLNDFNSALNEYKERQESIADRPEAHLNLGIMYENMESNDKAESSYKTAIRLANDFIPARVNLANFYNKTGRNKEAEDQFRKIIKLEPDNGEAYYSLGLLIAEMKRLEEAVEYLGKAVELVPDRARMRYNYSLALQHIGKRAEAEKEMLKAYQADKHDPGIVQAIAIFYVQEKKWGKALSYTEQLVDLVPNAKGPKQMLRQIREGLLHKSGNQ